LARTALILKNVAGGRIDPRSEPGTKSVATSLAACSSAANELDDAQMLIKKMSAVMSAGEARSRNFRRGVIEDVPFVRNVSQRLCVDLASQSVIGTETAAVGAYAELKRAKG
jgi:hypothetical protein